MLPENGSHHPQLTMIPLYFNTRWPHLQKLKILKNLSYRWKQKEKFFTVAFEFWRAFDLSAYNWHLGQVNHHVRERSVISFSRCVTRIKYYSFFFLTFLTISQSTMSIKLWTIFDMTSTASKRLSQNVKKILIFIYNYYSLPLSIYIYRYNTHSMKNVNY